MSHDSPKAEAEALLASIKSEIVKGETENNTEGGKKFIHREKITKEVHKDISDLEDLRKKLAEIKDLLAKHPEISHSYSDIEQKIAELEQKIQSSSNEVSDLDGNPVVQSHLADSVDFPELASIMEFGEKIDREVEEVKRRILEKKNEAISLVDNSDFLYWDQWSEKYQIRKNMLEKKDGVFSREQQSREDMERIQGKLLKFGLGSAEKHYTNAKQEADEVRGYFSDLNKEKQRFENITNEIKKAVVDYVKAIRVSVMNEQSLKLKSPQKLHSTEGQIKLSMITEKRVKELLKEFEPFIQVNYNNYDSPSFSENDIKLDFNYRQ